MSIVNETRLLCLHPGCKLLFRHDLTKSWGKHCHSCVYCHSVSKKLVTAQYGGLTEDFCSEECRSKYTMLFCHVSEPRCSYLNHSYEWNDGELTPVFLSGCKVRYLWSQRETEAESRHAGWSQTFLRPVLSSAVLLWESHHAGRRLQRCVLSLQSFFLPVLCFFLKIKLLWNQSVMSLTLFSRTCRYGGGHTYYRQCHVTCRPSSREIHCFWQNSTAKYTTHTP